MPLAQAISGVSAAIVCASDLITERMRLRRHDQQDRFAARRLGQRARHLDAVFKAHAGQKAALALACEMLGIAGVEFPQRDVAPGARARLRQRRSPGAAAEHG